MITAPLKAEIVEAYDQAMQDLRRASARLEDVASLVEIADRDGRLANARMRGELGNVIAELGPLRRRLSEIETYDEGKGKRK